MDATIKKGFFTAVSNKILYDENVSLKAKGLYALIQHFLSIPDFVLYKGTLMKHFSDGETSFRSAWKELKDAGYLTQKKVREEGGTFVYEYELLDTPDINKTTCGKTTCGKQSQLKTTQENNKKESNISLNNSNNIQFSNTNSTNQKDDVDFEKGKFLDSILVYVGDFMSIGYTFDFQKEVMTRLCSIIPVLSIRQKEYINDLSTEQIRDFYLQALDIYSKDSGIFNPDAYISSIIDNKSQIAFNRKELEERGLFC